MQYEKEFLISLLFTLITEIPVIVFFVRYLFNKKEFATLFIIFVGILSSALTLPYLWFVFPAFIFSRLWFVIIGEMFAIFIESIIYKKVLKLSFLNSLFISFVANIVSFLSGLIF